MNLSGRTRICGRVCGSVAGYPVPTRQRRHAEPTIAGECLISRDHSDGTHQLRSNLLHQEPDTNNPRPLAQSFSRGPGTATISTCASRALPRSGAATELIWIASDGALLLLSFSKRPR